MSELTARTYWRSLLANGFGDEDGFEVPLTEAECDSIETMVPGKARGRLVGGNLALIGAVMGTPFEIELPKASCCWKTSTSSPIGSIDCFRN